MKKFFVLLVVAVFLLPGFVCAQQAAPPAKSVSFYGSARMTMTYGKENAEFNNTIPGYRAGFGANNQFDDVDMNYRIGQALSSFGASFAQGPLNANIEIRPWAASYFRHWYGTYKSGDVTFIVGQTWTPTFAMCCEATEDGVGKAGDVQGSLRAPMLGLKWNGFFFSANVNQQSAAATFVPGTGDVDVMIPRLEASYDGVFGPLGFKVFGGYNTWKEVFTATDESVDINSWITGVNARLTFGPFRLTVLVHTGENYNQFGPSGLGADYGGMVGPRWIAASRDIIDAKYLGGHMTGVYKITPTLSVAAGLGKVRVTRDNPGFDEDKDDYMAYYLNFPIELAKGVNMTPEVGYQDGKEVRINNVTYDKGNFKYVNVWFKIGF